MAWWNQERVNSARALLVGAGGLGSNLAKIFVQMGIGHLSVIDPDLVEDSNRNRQLFTALDVGRPKAHRLLRNIRPYAVSATTLEGFLMTFEAWAIRPLRPRYDLICCGVDSVPTMIAVSHYGLRMKVPVVFYNISGDGEACRVFIQRHGATDPCFGCYMPRALDEKRWRNQSCIPIPAIADILQVAVGLGARAAIGEILGIPIGNYNCRDFTFTGFDLARVVKKRVDCSLCQEAL